MISDQKIRGELRASVSRLVKAREARGLVSHKEPPVRVIYGQAVPISGSMHVALGKTVSRKTIDKKFAK
jgi:hypothetical protein